MYAKSSPLVILVSGTSTPLDWLIRKKLPNRHQIPSFMSIPVRSPPAQHSLYYNLYPRYVAVVTSPPEGSNGFLL
jgi:hypothetical protein